LGSDGLVNSRRITGRKFEKGEGRNLFDKLRKLYIIEGIENSEEVPFHGLFTDRERG
jgi:hypothetical protein